MRGGRWPRSEFADCLMAIRISPTLVPVGPVWTRSPAASSAVPESNSRHARSTSQPPSVARSIVPASTIAPASLVGPSVPSVPARENQPAIAARAAAARRQRQMRIASAAAVAAPATSPWIRRPRPARRPAGRAASPTKSRGDCRPHRRRIAPRALRASRPRACAASRDRVHRVVDIGDDVPLDRDPRGRRPRPNNPEPMTSGSSPGTSEMNSASAGRPPSRRATPPPLSRDSRARCGIQRGDVPARGEPALIERAQIVERDAVAQALDEARAPPDTRNNGVTSRPAASRNRRSSSSARGEAALIGNRDARLSRSVSARQTRRAPDRRGRPW